MSLHLSQLVSIHKLSDEIKNGNFKSETGVDERNELLLMSEFDFKKIYNCRNYIYLVKDLKHIVGSMIHLSQVGKGMSYRRFNKQLNSVEYLGYSGYFGAWTDNQTYYARVMMENTQFHRKAQYMKFVSWLGINNRIEHIKLYPENPVYDIFIYHSCFNGFTMPTQTDVNMSICFLDPENG